MLKAKIESGELVPGDKLPSGLEIQRDYGIANVTTQKVFRQLRADGLVYTEPGMGTYVAERKAGTDSE